MPGLEQPEGLAARSSILIIRIHVQCVNGLSKSIWRAFFVPGNRKEVKKEIPPPMSYLEDWLEQIMIHEFNDLTKLGGKKAMRHTRSKNNGTKRHMRMLAILLVPVVALILGVAAPELLASGRGHDDHDDVCDEAD